MRVSMNMMKAFCLLVSLCLTGLAQNDPKASVVQTFRANRYGLDALILERYVNIKASPEWWRLAETEVFNSQGSFTHELANLADTVNRISVTMGWGDANRLDRDTGQDGSNPLVINLVESWKGKILVNLDMNFRPDNKTRAMAIDNLDRCLNPFGSDYVFKPRAGHAVINLRMDPKATMTACKVSLDGAVYEVIIPIYTDLSQGDLEEALKKGR